MPREIASQQVDEEEADAFEVISPALLLTLVSCQGGVSRSSCQALSVSPRNVLSFLVLVALGESKVDRIDFVRIILAIAADQEVVWLDIAV